MRGLCACGCGQATSLAKRNYRYMGIMKGEPMRYVVRHGSGHVRRLPFTEADLEEMERLYVVEGLSTPQIASRFKCLSGSISSRLNARGLKLKARPKPAIPYLSNAYVRIRGKKWCRRVAEEILGRPLQPGECVHHINGDKTDDRPENLEVLPSHSAHMQKHRAERETWTQQEDDQLRYMLMGNLSDTRIAAEFGVSRSRVQNRRQRLKRRGELEGFGRPVGRKKESPR